jgi:hypothetical protein
VLLCMACCKDWVWDSESKLVYLSFASAVEEFRMPFVDTSHLSLVAFCCTVGPTAQCAVLWCASQMLSGL